MKIAIFYEGESEEELLKAFFIKYCYNFHRTEDPLDFQTHRGPCVLFYPCGGYQNVFPYAHKNDYLYKNDFLLLIRDLENTSCYTALNDEAQSSCNQLVKQNCKGTLFAAPNLESVYEADRPTLKRILERYWSKTYNGKPTPPDFEQDFNNINLSLGWREIEKFAKKYKISYRKRQTAEIFFNQFDFSSSQYPYFVRLRGIFSNGVCHGLTIQNSNGGNSNTADP